MPRGVREPANREIRARWGLLSFANHGFWPFTACFRHFSEVSGTTLRKNVKDNILILLQRQKIKTSLPLFGLSELPMTMDSSLKVKAGAIRARNVLTRAERIARLQELDRFDAEESVVGMPKVRVVKVSLKKKKKVTVDLSPIRK